MKKIILLVCLLLTGCSIFQKPTAVIDEASDKADSQAMTKCTYDKVVCEYFSKGMDALSRAFTMTITSTDPASRGQVIKTSMDGKGNIQTIVSVGGKEQSGMVVLNQATYIKNMTDGSWWKYEASGQEENQGFDMNATIEEMQEKYNPESEELEITSLGEEKCGALDCYKYEMYVKKTPSDKTIVWFDKKDYLARKMEVTANSYTSTMEYDYTPVTILEPSPVKTMPNPGAMMQKDQLPSQEDIDKMMESLPNLPDSNNLDN